MMQYRIFLQENQNKSANYRKFDNFTPVFTGKLFIF